MNKYAVASVVAAFAVVSAAIFLAKSRLDKPANSGNVQSIQSSRASSKTAAAAHVAAPQPPPRADTSETTGLPGQAESLKSATDYLEYAQSALEAARRGDHGAQYYLSQALHYCDSGYRLYFDRRGKRRTLDEAQQWAAAAAPGMSADEAKQIYDRCHRLMDEGHRPDFGKSADWIEQSSNGGFALGQVAKAQSLLRESATSGADPEPAKVNAAKKLAIEALRSRSPEVVWQIGDMALSFFGAEKAEDEELVWRIAACERGYDCGKDADWLAFACRFDRNCQPYETGVDYLRRVTGQDFDEIEQRAKDVNAKLDADQFDDLGF
jgi:hypothetical protein